jgi:hypothetical protein
MSATARFDSGGTALGDQPQYLIVIRGDIAPFQRLGTAVNGVEVFV